MLRAGIIGLPLVGKTTIFTLLTQAKIAAHKKEPNLGIATVPDERLAPLAKIFQPKKITPVTIEYTDVAGIVKGEAAKESPYLNSLRQVDLILHVVRSFKDESVPHAGNDIDPRRDINVLEFELMLADLIAIDKRLDRLAKDMKRAKSRDNEIEFEILKKLKFALEQEQPLRELDLPEEEEKKMRGFAFLSAKPVLYAISVGEEELSDIDRTLTSYGLRDHAKKRNAGLLVMSPKIEKEISELPPQEALAFLRELGLKELATNRLIKETYTLLNLITFFTGNENEVRAWSIKRATTALKAAGTVHSDFERGFIRAEVVKYDDLIAQGSLHAAREKGLLKLEGKEYVVSDGDVINFRFHL